MRFVGEYGGDLAAEHHDDPIGQSKELIEIGRDEQHRRAAFGGGEDALVDEGGGGTIAKYMANRNIDTIDAGVPVMSMHAPFEVVAKFDCFMTYLGVLAAYKA